MNGPATTWYLVLAALLFGIGTLVFTARTQSQHIADSHAAAQVLLDAIGAAGSLDREKINAAIARTNKTYVIGPVKFDAQNTYAIPIAVMQWQDGKAVVVWPKDRANGKLIFPLPEAR